MKKLQLVSSVLLSVGLPISGAFAQDANALAKQLANPLAALISLPVQQNLDYGYTNDGWKSTTNIQPVIPVSISEDWNVISRTIIPYNYAEDLVRPGSAKGFGDILQSTFFSPKAPTRNGWIWGAGPVVSLPTGDDDFTVDEWLLGPTAVFLKQDGAVTYGALINHVWDVSGDTDVSATFFQPFLAYGAGGGATYTVNLESTYDWNSDQWTVPVNLVYSKVTSIGSQLVSLSAGVRAYIDKPDGGPDWGLRFVCTFLFPKG
jgi:hypothetical protein